MPRTRRHGNLIRRCKRAHIFLLLSRIIANPLSNVFQKKLGSFADARFIILVTCLLLMLACMPVLFYLLPLALGMAFRTNMLICARPAVGGNTLSVAALKSADLSVPGPLNAYKSIVGMLLGAWMPGEYPNMLGIASLHSFPGGIGPWQGALPSC